MRTIKFKSADGSEVVCDILSQQTGINDSNGREIYENDIYKCEYLTFACVWVKELSCFIFMEKEAYRTYISSEDIYSVHGKYRFITVQDVLDDNGVYLGNIYDNPELLE